MRNTFSQGQACLSALGFMLTELDLHARLWIGVYELLEASI